jgi:hypothetical protein
MMGVSGVIVNKQAESVAQGSGGPLATICPLELTGAPATPAPLAAMTLK